MGITIGTVGGSATLTTTTGGLNLYFNSVSMTGSMGSGSATALTAAIYVGSGASALNIRNNAFSNTQVGTSTTQKNYAIYSAAANTAFTAIDYNDYFVSNTFNAPSAIPGFIGSDRVDLAGVQSGFGQNLNSKIVDPSFISATNCTCRRPAACLVWESRELELPLILTAKRAMRFPISARMRSWLLHARPLSAEPPRVEPVSADRVLRRLRQVDTRPVRAQPISGNTRTTTLFRIYTI
jgi:hypothetical protein